MTNTTDPLATVDENAPTLRLVWPQWPGAGVESIRALFSEMPLKEARRGYAVGAAVLDAVCQRTPDRLLTFRSSSVIMVSRSRTGSKRKRR